MIIRSFGPMVFGKNPKLGGSEDSADDMCRHSRTYPLASN